MTIPVFELLRAVLPADPVLVGGVALLVGALVGHFLSSIYGWIRSILIGLAIRHTILAVLGVAGLSLEAFIPGGILGTLSKMVGFLPF